MDDQQGVVLLDVSPGSDGEFDRVSLERMGHPVLVCHGPSEELCPLLGGHGCPKLERAHGVVFKLDLGRAQHRAILARYQRLAHPDAPIRVLVTPGDAERYAGLLMGAETWTTSRPSPISTGSQPRWRPRTDSRERESSPRVRAGAGGEGPGPEHGAGDQDGGRTASPSLTADGSSRATSGPSRPAVATTTGIARSPRIRMSIMARTPFAA